MGRHSVCHHKYSKVICYECKYLQLQDCLSCFRAEAFAVLQCESEVNINKYDKDEEGEIEVGWKQVLIVCSLVGLPVQARKLHFTEINLLF